MALIQQLYARFPQTEKGKELNYLINSNKTGENRESFRTAESELNALS